MHIETRRLEITTRERIQVMDVTAEARALVADAGVSQGLLVASSRHTTTALAVNEFEERLVEDLKIFLDRLAPPGAGYLHDDIHLRDCPPDEPRNAQSHLTAMLLSSTEALPVVDGALALGRWQSLLLLELDGPRERTLTLQVLGR